jgi:hypothetical protein
MNEELWKPVLGYVGRYEVSTLGRVRSLLRGGRILKPRAQEEDYCFVALYNDGIRADVRVHRIVALAFIPNPENKPEVNHDDGDRQNNAISNLFWATSLENNQHAARTGLKPRLFTNQEVRLIRAGVNVPGCARSLYSFIRRRVIYRDVA